MNLLKPIFLLLLLKLTIQYIINHIEPKMSSSIKPIQVYGASGPNPPKVAIVLAELDIPHEIVPTKISEVKSPEYLAIVSTQLETSYHNI